MRITWKMRKKACSNPRGRNLGQAMLHGQQCWSPVNGRCADLCESIGQKVCTCRRLVDYCLEKTEGAIAVAEAVPI